MSAPLIATMRSLRAIWRGSSRYSMLYVSKAGFWWTTACSSGRVADQCGDELVGVGVGVLAGDHAALDERHEAAHGQLGEVGEVLALVERAKPRERAGVRADADLNRVAVLDQFGDVVRDAQVDLVGWRMLKIDHHRRIAGHEVVDLGDVQPGVAEGLDRVGVDLGDYLFRALGGAHAVPDAAAERDEAGVRSVASSGSAARRSARPRPRVRRPRPCGCRPASRGGSRRCARRSRGGRGSCRTAGPDGRPPCGLR